LSDFAFVMRRRIPSFVKDPGFNGWSCVTFYPSFVSLRGWRSLGEDKVWSGVNSFHICCESVLYGIMSTSLSISKEKEGGRWTENANDLYFSFVQEK
jgi:hypothetical protein